MRKLITICFCFIFVVLFSSCNFIEDRNKNKTLSEKDFNEVFINNEYSLALPKYLRKANNLNDEASLQYQNLAREAYVIVIDESKEDIIASFKEAEIYNDSLSPLENYSKYQNEYFNDALNKKTYDSGLTDKTINNWPAKVMTVEGEYYEVDFEIAYWIAYIETDEKMYNVMCWTLASKRSDFEETYRKVINSFKTIK